MKMAGKLVFATVLLGCMLLACHGSHHRNHHDDYESANNNNNRRRSQNSDSSEASNENILSESDKKDILRRLMDLKKSLNNDSDGDDDDDNNNNNDADEHVVMKIYEHRLEECIRRRQKCSVHYLLDDNAWGNDQGSSKFSRFAKHHHASDSQNGGNGRWKHNSFKSRQQNRQQNQDNDSGSNEDAANKIYKGL